VCILQGHGEWVTAVAVTPDGGRVVSASADKTVRVWELKTGRFVRTLQGHGDRVTAVAITPDGRFVVSASDDKTVRIWELKAGQSIGILRATATG
jgi:WD40 repeat protein